MIYNIIYHYYVVIKSADTVLSGSNRQPGSNLPTELVCVWFTQAT